MNAEKNDVDIFIDWNNQLLCEKNLSQYLQQVNQLHDGLKKFFDNTQEKIDENISRFLQIPYNNYNESGNFIGDYYRSFIQQYKFMINRLERAILFQILENYNLFIFFAFYCQGERNSLFSSFIQMYKISKINAIQWYQQEFQEFRWQIIQKIQKRTLVISDIYNKVFIKMLELAFTLEKYRGNSQTFIYDHSQILKICKVFVVLNQFFEKNLKPGKSQLKFYRIFMVLKTRIQLYDDEEERFQIEENEESNGQNEKQEEQNEIENASKENEKSEEKKEKVSNLQKNSEGNENQIKSEQKILDEKNEEEKQNDEDEEEEFGNIQQPQLSKMFTVDPQYKTRKEKLEQQQQLQIQKQNEQKENKEKEDEEFSQIQEDLKMRKRFSSIYQRNQIDFLKLQYIMETELSELIEYVIQSGKSKFWRKYKRTQETKFSGEKKDIQKILKQEIKSYSKKQKKQKGIWNLDFQIDRNNIFQSSISSLIYLYPSSYISGHLDIRFEQEEGIDAGGLQREWFNLFFKEAFDPKFGLFQVSANKVTVQPSPLAKIVPNYQLYFRIIGRLVGKVIYDKMEVEVNFTRSFLKHILRKDLYITDLEDIDPEQFNNLNWMLENSVEGLELNYTHCVDELGIIKTVDLVERGSEIEITNENKKEYVKDIAHYIMTESIKEQTESFIQGFYDIVPISALKEVSEQQLGLILSGHQIIDVDDMEKNAIYQSGYTQNSDVIKWLWQILKYDWNEDQKSQFLFFITGGFKVPHGGFKEYQIEFYKEDNPNQLPVAHTCSRGLDLPAYSSKEILKEKLEIAIYEGAKGFHIG